MHQQPVQEWPSDDSDFETENLPGYKKRKGDSDSDEDSGDSDYEDSPPAGKRRKTPKKKEKSKARRGSDGRISTTKNSAKASVPVPISV